MGPFNKLEAISGQEMSEDEGMDCFLRNIKDPAHATSKAFLETNPTARTLKELTTELQKKALVLDRTKGDNEITCRAPEQADDDNAQNLKPTKRSRNLEPASASASASLTLPSIVRPLSAGFIRIRPSSDWTKLD